MGACTRKACGLESFLLLTAQPRHRCDYPHKERALDDAESKETLAGARRMMLAGFLGVGACTLLIDVEVESWISG